PLRARAERSFLLVKPFLFDKRKGFKRGGAAGAAIKAPEMQSPQSPAARSAAKPLPAQGSELFCICFQSHPYINTNDYVSVSLKTREHRFKLTVV
ncbi:MAG: hypothetical protein K2K51_05480, partial [Bacteroidales bacterium]|nr:hypothetical protein [Bacteroidales bacterium]